VLFSAGAESEPNMQANRAIFSDALRGSGWIEGRNITVDYRWAGGDLRRIQMFAKELMLLLAIVSLLSTRFDLWSPRAGWFPMGATTPMFTVELLTMSTAY
jgi:hypothetical protein